MPADGTRPSYVGDGKPSRISFFKDGQGESEPIPKIKPGARYIYYRVYTKDGPLESKHPIYANDRFISRIASTLVRPPQTAASLTRYLCKIEGLEHRQGALYQSLSDNTALDGSTRLSFRGTPGPGTSAVDPVALIVDTHTPEKRSQASGAVELMERDYEQRYVYYRLYDDDGGAVSKTTFGENNATLGRVNTLSVPPPHTVSSLKNCIIKSEDLSGHNVQLFEDEGSESAMNDSDPLFSDTFPGFIEDRPIAITCELGMKDGSAGNEDPNEIQIRELRAALAQIKKGFEEANVTHARELAEVREGCEKAKETHVREINEALSTILPAQLKSLTCFFTLIASAIGAAQLACAAVIPVFSGVPTDFPTLFSRPLRNVPAPTDIPQDVNAFNIYAGPLECPHSFSRPSGFPPVESVDGPAPSDIPGDAFDKSLAPSQSDIPPTNMSF
ncbi:hypothetical protein K443DRAFT_11279 [Laccaria amethystina LaAM-08-1]|uniref:Uncharacterized protein n=1 Tax=Laccaria amethystina LaAM-08-1 TaxID=1095629 RepID=A0A0C9WJZ6_9AGAR|nr:hypothetical protein K443DRAFT_11279 [Laccaria amethystina LaAM-08-1]